MTAVAVARASGLPGRGAVAPASATASLRRFTGTLHEPNAWTAGIVVATGLVLIARHPIAHLLGTEVDSPPVTTVAPAPVLAPTTPALAPAAVGVVVAAIPTHAPRDPFRALVSAGGKVLAPVTMPTTAASAAKQPAPAAPAVPTTGQTTGPTTASTAPTSPATVPSAAGCDGTIHRVAAGDTLWTLAARAVHSSDSDRVTIAWHRLYAANRDAVGSNPSLLPVGATLCVPSSL